MYAAALSTLKLAGTKFGFRYATAAIASRIPRDTCGALATSAVHAAFAVLGQLVQYPPYLTPMAAPSLSTELHNFVGSQVGR